MAIAARMRLELLAAGFAILQIPLFLRTQTAFTQGFRSSVASAEASGDAKFLFVPLAPPLLGDIAGAMR